jgi:hypothetical protein
MIEGEVKSKIDINVREEERIERASHANVIKNSECFVQYNFKNIHIVNEFEINYLNGTNVDD